MHLLNLLSPASSEFKTKHYIGLPPSLTDGLDRRIRLPDARFLVLVENPDGFFIYRFNDAGQCVGDTWHPTSLDAQQQATYEFGESLGEWIAIPMDVGADILQLRDFGLQKIRA